MLPAQSSRVGLLLARLSLLEESAAQLAAPLAQKAASRTDSLLARAKYLSQRVARLELLQQAPEAEVMPLIQASRRVQLLENGVIRVPAQFTENTLRVSNALGELGYEDFDLLRVPDGKRYYQDLSLQDRACLLQASTSDALCKTLLFSASGDELDKANLFLLVINYTQRISPSKFKSEIKRLFPGAKTPKQASEEVMQQVLGFPLNGVSVVGGLGAPLPIVFASAVASNQEIFLGGGEVDVKLRVGNVQEFIQRSKSVVLDVTDKREEEEEEPAASKPVSKAVSKAAPKEETTTTEKANPPRKSEKRAHESDGSGGEEATTFTFDDLDVRVGLVTKCWRHPDSAKLLCEEIDLGEDTGPRQIASGIQAYYTPEELTGKRVCVVANLKPAKLAGFASNGMVLCASFEDQVRVVEAPEAAALGARLVFDKKKDPAAAPAAVKKKKILEKVLPNLCLDKEGKHVEYLGKALSVEGVEGGTCQIPTGGAPGAKVS
ncbi:methionine-tRNA ligase, beta subunit [Batrachochytrium salamandrivorans]|nr:methionine-tRNA ligase, beta subunit [Batrachochytrium salamandrivorans]